jgi:hypothetical protein
VNLTISIGVRASPHLPPMVPLMPDIDLINVIAISFLFKDKKIWVPGLTFLARHPKILE